MRVTLLGLVEEAVRRRAAAIGITGRSRSELVDRLGNPLLTLWWRQGLFVAAWLLDRSVMHVEAALSALMAYDDLFDRAAWIAREAAAQGVEVDLPAEARDAR